MIRLDAITKILQLTASGTADVIVDGALKTASAYTGFSEVTAATASTQTICAAPGASEVKDIDHVTIKNTSGAANTLTVKGYNSSGTVTTQSVQVILQANESAEYTHARGWMTKDANGQEKLVMPGYLPLTGGTLSGDLAINGTALTTTSATFTVFAGATTLLALGGTGASAVVAIPGTLEWSSTTAALTVAGGVYIAKKLAVVGALTVAGVSATSPLTLKTRQVFLSGTAATYTTPANCRQIRVRMKGGGGCGAPTSTSGAPTQGSNGGATSFNSVVANGGTKGDSSTGTGSAGGTGGTGTASFRLAGISGNNYACFVTSSTNEQILGGLGGGQGGGTGGNAGSAGSAGKANTGGGGGGAGLASASFATIAGGYPTGQGGGEGEYAELIIDSPSATYTYTVGAGGTASTGGTGGYAGGAGGSGYITVDEFY